MRTNSIIKTDNAISLLVWPIVAVLVCSTLTRVLLVILHFGDIAGSFALIIPVMIEGLFFDLFVALCVSFPLAFALLVFPAKWRKFKPIHWITTVGWFVFLFAQLYLIATELFFFNEFSSRFNYVAVDYLFYPHEVFINIWETYPVLTVIIACVILALATAIFTRKGLIASLVAYPKRIKSRFGWIGGLVAVALILLWGITLLPNQLYRNRVLNEISLNGVYSFFEAVKTNEMDYNQYYATIDEDEAFKRLRAQLADSNSQFLGGDYRSIARHIISDFPYNRYNVVLILEESMSYEFVGDLEPDGPNLTPRIDSLADNGLMFEHIFSTGNRTVRGLEATLLSFPPIPGRSVVKRPDNEHMFSLPALFHDEDYSTIFLYGGLSYFDNFGYFAANNGFDRVVDELDFKDPIFKTIWGVCDEDLFNKSLTLFDSLDQEDEPFFATLVTVSNHSPYTYPKGRIPYNPDEQHRVYSVRYADYALGKFINDAKSHQFFDSTLFVMVADHGARVYGSQQIPLRSYRIPLLFYSPSLIPERTRVAVTGSQLDIAPTIMDILGFDYNSMFFGRSLLSTPADKERVLMSHNRDASLMRNDTLLVLNIKKGEEWWSVDSSGDVEGLEQDADTGISLDAMAYYMTAYNMFKRHELHPLVQSHASSADTKSKRLIQ